MQDLADLAGVSLSTIDRILNSRTKVKQSTVLHVLETSERIGFYGTPTIRERLSQHAPPAHFGFLLNASARPLYREFGNRLLDRTRSSRRVLGTGQTVHLKTLNEDEMVNGLYRLAQTCHAVAAVLFDTPKVAAAVRDLFEQGIPVISLLSDFAPRDRASFVGADPEKIGRGAAWIVHQMLSGGGSVALLTGSFNYHAHRNYIQSFEAYLEANCPDIFVGPAHCTQECNIQAEEIAEKILADKHPDAIIVAGGGMEGVLKAMCRNNETRKIKIIGTELSPLIQKALADHQIDAVLSHPIASVVESAVTVMENCRLFGNSRSGGDRVVPVEIQISETI